MVEIVHKLKPVIGSISSGTLRTQDLLRAFAKELESLLPFAGRTLYTKAREMADLLDSLDRDGAGAEYEREISSYLVDELRDSLGDIAIHHGMGFGASEGDGANFGFWPIESEDE